MPIGSNIQAWRVSRGHSVTALAAKAGLPVDVLEAIETGQLDPPLSVMEAVATALGIPPSWLYSDPKHLALLTADPDGDESDLPSPDTADPVIERILIAAQQERELYVLLTRLLHAGDPKLIRAAEVSLRSLVKQAKQATVPWQSRPPGHFEPPSD
jgi:transcriptional regulator with XRE-family HTH domain